MVRIAGGWEGGGGLPPLYEGGGGRIPLYEGGAGRQYRGLEIDQNSDIFPKNTYHIYTQSR